MSSNAADGNNENNATVRQQLWLQQESIHLRPGHLHPETQIQKACGWRVSGLLVWFLSCSSFLTASRPDTHGDTASSIFIYLLRKSRSVFQALSGSSRIYVPDEHILWTEAFYNSFLPPIASFSGLEFLDPFLDPAHYPSLNINLSEQLLSHEWSSNIAVPRDEKPTPPKGSRPRSAVPKKKPHQSNPPVQRGTFNRPSIPNSQRNPQRLLRIQLQASQGTFSRHRDMNGFFESRNIGGYSTKNTFLWLENLSGVETSSADTLNTLDMRYISEAYISGSAARFQPSHLSNLSCQGKWVCGYSTTLASQPPLQVGFHRSSGTRSSSSAEIDYSNFDGDDRLTFQQAKITEDELEEDHFRKWEREDEFARWE